MKYARLRNFIAHRCDAKHFKLPKSSVYAYCFVHSLYAMADYESVIKNMYKSLQDEGKCFVCDLWRILDVRKWAIYLFKEWIKTHGVAKALNVFIKGRTVAKANINISKLQKSGLYWTHDMSEIVNLFISTGFFVDHAKLVYRGDSDLLLCTKRM